MKYLITAILFLLCFSVFANYIPQSKVDGNLHNGLTVSSKIDRCEKSYSESCVKIPFDYNHNYHILIDEMIDDVSSPVYTKTNVELCTDEADCLTKESEKECLDGEIVIRVAENTEVYCSKFIRYNQIASGNKIVIEDVDKKAVYESTEALIEADEMAMLAANESLKCGKKVIARMLLLNSLKDLTKAQVKQFVKGYGDIKDLLETGSLESAREDIVASVPDGTVLTDQDKTIIIQELDGCRP